MNLENLTLFQPFTTIVICSLICLYNLEACIANNMNPDQTAPLGAVFASMVWCALWPSMKSGI